MDKLKDIFIYMECSFNISNINLELQEIEFEFNIKNM